jgi:hypothetical protein
MERLAIIGRLKEGAQARAAELLDRQPPFDLAQSGLVSHSIYLSTSEVVFLFEAHEVEWIVDDQLNGQFLHPALADALGAWRAILDGEPRVAREHFSWQRGPAETPASRRGDRGG